MNPIRPLGTSGLQLVSHDVTILGNIGRLDLSAQGRAEFKAEKRHLVTSF